MSIIPITKPGVYSISMEAYHNAECCDAPSISGSGVVMLAPPEGIAARAPIKFWAKSTMNPNREPVDTKPLRIGKCTHALFLEGIDAVQQAFIIDNLPRTGEGSRNAVKAFEAKAAAEGKIIIREEAWNGIKAMVAALEHYPLMRAAFSDGKIEQTLCWKDEETGVWCRARPDFLPTDPTHMPEYKTSASATPEFFERQIDDYGYHIKAVHMMAGIRALGLGDPQTFTHWVQEKDEPFLVWPHTLPRETIEYAEVQRRTALRTFARCLERNQWPGYPAAPIETGLPGYTLKRLQAADLSGTQQENDNEPPRYSAVDYIRA